MTPIALDESGLEQFLVERDPKTRKNVYHIPSGLIDYNWEVMRDHWGVESNIQYQRGRPYDIVTLYEK
jgi:hypothetical protein